MNAEHPVRRLAEILGWTYAGTREQGSVVRFEHPQLETEWIEFYYGTDQMMMEALARATVEIQEARA